MRARDAGPTPRRAAGPWGLVAWALPAAAVLLSQMQVNDLAFQVRAGRLMWDAGALLRHDVFTYTIAGAPWTNQQWGAQLSIAAAYGALGWRGLVFLQGMVVGAVYAATYRRTSREGAAPLVAALVTLSAFATALVLPGSLALRPQLVALPLFVGTAWIVGNRAAAPRRLLFLPLLGVVWANVHGSFPLLTVLLAIAFVADLAGRRGPMAWRTGSLALVSLATPLLSPWGIGIYRYLADLSSSQVVREVIAEWRPILTRMPAGAVFLGVVAAGAFVFVRRATRRPNLEETLGLLTFTGLALWSGRNVLWWSVAVPPVVGGLLAGWPPADVWSKTATRVCALAMACLLLLGSLRVMTRPVDELLTEDASPGLTASLAALTQEGRRAFTTRWASWFELALPGVPMFVDARVELFPDSIWDEYFVVVGVRGDWRDVLDRWHVSVVAAHREDDRELIDALSREPGWTVAYEDAEGVVFERIEPGVAEPVASGS